MPSCVIKNCTNRTGAKNIKFFPFPKEPDFFEQWIKACGKNEREIKFNSARICSLHFNENCFEMVWTKPRQKNIPSKQMLRLKEGSIPSKLLNIEKKRKRTFEDNDDKKRKKVLICTGVPTYAELVQYMQEKQHAYLEQTTSEDVCEDEHNLSLNVTTKVITNEKITCEENVSVQTLLELLKKSEEEKNKLLMEKAELIEENEKLNDKYTKLNLQFELLEKNMQEKSILSQKK